MVLTEREFAQAEAIFLLIDNGVVSYEQTHTFMSSMYNLNYEIFAFMDWLLTRWVLLRKHKLHLPTRIEQPQCVNLTNLINSNSS